MVRVGRLWMTRSPGKNMYGCQQASKATPKAAVKMEDAEEALVMASRFQARSLDKTTPIHTIPISLRLTSFGAGVCVCCHP